MNTLKLFGVSSGRTKENHEGRKQQAEKISGENNPAKRPDVRATLSRTSSGEKNGMYGKYGENSPASKLSNKQRLEIIQEFENGVEKSVLFDKYKHIVKSGAIYKLLANKEQVKQRLLGELNETSSGTP